MTEYLLPKRAWASGSVRPEKLLKRQSLQIGLVERETTELAEGDYLILDFGLELCGGLRL